MLAPLPAPYHEHRCASASRSPGRLGSAVGDDRVPNLSDGPQRGAMLGHAICLWRFNTYWVSLITYRPSGAIGAANLLPGMDRPPQRHLSAEDRDFFAV
jgi:hypothetical protein